MENLKNALKTSLLVLLIMTQHALFAQTNPDAIIGTFESAKGDRKIEIYKEGSEYFGKIVSLSSTKGKARVGMVILKNLKFSNGQWTGKLYVPARDNDYNTILSLPESNTLVISAKAGPMSQEREWKRVSK